MRECLSLPGFDFYFRCIDSVNAPEARSGSLGSHLSLTKYPPVSVASRSLASAAVELPVECT